MEWNGAKNERTNEQCGKVRQANPRNRIVQTGIDQEQQQARYSTTILSDDTSKQASIYNMHACMHASNTMQRNATQRNAIFGLVQQNTKQARATPLCRARVFSRCVRFEHRKIEFCLLVWFDSDWIELTWLGSVPSGSWSSSIQNDTTRYDCQTIHVSTDRTLTRFEAIHLCIHLYDSRLSTASPIHTPRNTKSLSLFGLFIYQSIISIGSIYRHNI